jgi:hypothetical protein
MVLGHARYAYRYRPHTYHPPPHVPPLKDRRCLNCRLHDFPTDTRKYGLVTCLHRTDFAPTRTWGGQHIDRRLITLQRTPLIFLQPATKPPTSPNGHSISYHRDLERQDGVVDAEVGVTKRNVHRRSSTRSKRTMVLENFSNNCLRYAWTRMSLNKRSTRLGKIMDWP